MQVGIVVPKRPEFHDTYWVLQRKFFSGFHVVDVDERQLAELRADPVVSLVEGTELEASLTAATEPSAPVVEPEKPGKPMKRG
jgi:hypothetical protein